jgi:hypothetical protein
MVQRMAMLDKAWYGDIMGFQFRTIVNGEVLYGFTFVRGRIHPHDRYFDPFYTDLVFVLSEEEAQGFPDNIITAWPRTGEREPTARIINEIHHGIGLTESDLIWPGETDAFREVVTLEEFELSYPVTASDFVDNWRQVDALWSALQWTGGVRDDE